MMQIDEIMDDKFIGSIEELGAMPSIALDVMGLINDTGSTVDDIVKRLRLDEALVAYILKFCNSAAFGMKREITGITQGINLLGFTKLKTLLMSYFTKNLYLISSNDPVKSKLWEHSIGVAIFSKVVGEALKQNGEELYLAGLFHDIGKLVLFKYNRNLFIDSQNSAFEKDEESIFAETEIFSCSHVEVGVLLLEKWQFNESLIEMVKYHHAADQYSGANKNVKIVSFADKLVLRHIEGHNSVDYLDSGRTLGFSDAETEKLIIESLRLKDEYLSVL